MAELSRRFLESTRGQVLTQLRRGPATVEELARGIGLTDNAIRSHLSTLERDALVRQTGTRRGPGAGKPAVVYELAPDAEMRLSRAYAPVLTNLLEELSGRLPPEQTEAVLLAVGQRLAQSVPRSRGSLDQRVRDAATLLNELGGDASVESDGSDLLIRGCGCPLSVAVARRPEACRAVQGLLSEIIGVPVRQCCEQGPHPRCCFTVPSAA
ncbi:MAG: helix-turn-helix transcriptional regulator [Gemmatimonadales bacterium]